MIAAGESPKERFAKNDSVLLTCIQKRAIVLTVEWMRGGDMMSACTPTGLLIKQIHDCLEKKSNNALRAKGLTMMQVSVLLALQDA